jgi:hypothetical protein
MISQLNNVMLHQMARTTTGNNLSNTYIVRLRQARAAGFP